MTRGLSGFGVVAVLSLAGCAVIEPVSRSLEAPAGYSTSNNPAKAQDLANWWTSFNDPVLVIFMQQALERNLDLALAVERVEELRRSAAFRKADQLPTLDLGNSVTGSYASKQTAAARRSGGPTERDSAEFQVESGLSWEIDLFGRKKALRKASEARLEAGEADRDAVRLLVASEVARLTITARFIQARIALATGAAATEEEFATLTQAKRRGGQVSEAEVLRAKGQRDDSLAEASQLESDYNGALRDLSILLNDEPAKVRQALMTAASPTRGTMITNAGLPSELLRRRPDLRQAERELAAESQELAAKAADRYPRVNLTAMLGLAADSLTRLPTGGAFFATGSPALTWRAFDFGRLDAEIAAARSRERQALLNYKKTLTTAFAEADTALTDQAARETTVTQRETALAASRAAWEVTRLEYERGQVDFSTALETKRTLNRAETNLTLSQQSQLLAQVTTFRALGGGW